MPVSLLLSYIFTYYDQFDDRERGNVLVVRDAQHHGGMGEGSQLARHQTYFKFMERIRLEHDVEKHGYDSFVPDTVVHAHVSRRTDDTVPAQVAPAPAVRNVSHIDWDHESDAFAAYQAHNMTYQSSKAGILSKSAPQTPLCTPTVPYARPMRSILVCLTFAEFISVMSGVCTVFTHDVTKRCYTF